MQGILAITKLTWKAAFRFRLFWVLAGLLLISVVLLPLLLKDDGTARGFTQILLTYTLTVITTLLGFSTLWLACGTLAREVEECQMQMVAVKPIARWQIWLGKWLGLLLLNATLLALAGSSVFALLQWRAKKLPSDQQTILRNEIFVARGTLREPVRDIERDLERIFQERITQTPVPPGQHQEVRQNLRAQLLAGMQVVPPGYRRRWEIDLGLRRTLLQDQPLFLRAKFHVARTNVTGTYIGLWQVGEPEKPQFWRGPIMSQAADTFHEFAIPPNLIEPNGMLRVEFWNQNDTALLFPLEDGFEVLYREGGFGLNFTRGLLIILAWMGLLAALGLAAASFLSFPVAAFVSASLLIVFLSSGTLSAIVAEGTLSGADHETGEVRQSWFDRSMIGFYRVLLLIVNSIQKFSPIDSLSTGRSISWEQLGLAWATCVLLMGGLVGGMGMAIFTRRELATAQGTS
jgi:ABC-type transport system involved in multi-copper enzyme maturation permease subunit